MKIKVSMNYTKITLIIIKYLYPLNFLHTETVFPLVIID